MIYASPFIRNRISEDITILNELCLEKREMVGIGLFGETRHGALAFPGV